MASYQQRGDKVRVSICVRGIRETFTADSKREAVTWAKLREAELLKGAKAKAKGGHTLRQAIEHYREKVAPRRKSWKAEVARCNFLINTLEFVDKPLGKVTRDDIQDWADERANTLEGSTVRRDLTFLSGVFKEAEERKWVHENPVRAVKRPENNDPRNRRIEGWEVDKILGVLGYTLGEPPVTRREQLAVAFLLAIETAMRVGEIMQTQWVNVHEKYIHIPKDISKTNRARNVPFTPSAQMLVEMLTRGEGRMFPDLTRKRADVLFRAAVRKAKIENLHFHDTRHEAVTRLAQKLPILDLARMVGHSDINSLQIYYNATPEEIFDRLR